MRPYRILWMRGTFAVVRWVTGGGERDGLRGVYNYSFVLIWARHRKLDGKKTSIIMPFCCKWPIYCTWSMAGNCRQMEEWYHLSSWVTPTCCRKSSWLEFSAIPLYYCNVLYPWQRGEYGDSIFPKQWLPWTAAWRAVPEYPPWALTSASLLSSSWTISRCPPWAAARRVLHCWSTG
jgi:hypothetical protein